MKLLSLPEKNNRSAVIDVGSNSVRLLMPEKIGVNEKLLNTTRLAENLSLTGFLSDDAMTRTENAVVEFFGAAKKRGYDNVYVFATEAVRAAKNGSEFVKRLDARGIKADVISGEKEAEIGFLGAAGNKKSAAVFDIGGASVEIVCGKYGKISRRKSLPLGLVRLKDVCGKSENETTAYVSERMPLFGAFDKAETLIGIGGTATSVAAMLSGEKKYDPQKIHGSTVSLEKLCELKERVFDELEGQNLHEVFPVISAMRAEIIPHGIIVAEAVMRYLGYDEFTVSETDNMEGYLLSLVTTAL